VSTAASRFRSIARGASTVLALLSPFALYAALAHGSTRVAAALVIGWVVLRGAAILAGAEREQRLAMVPLLGLGLGSALLGWVTAEPRFLLMLPSLTQVGFALLFLVSLRRGARPLVEHFARMQKPALPPAEVQYCRVVTVVWGVALALAAVTGVALAFTASLATWTAFSGVGSYVLVGALFSVEYVVRKARFREYGTGPIDRTLARVFPPRA
jgi:uncharacterized membrane protein